MQSSALPLGHAADREMIQSHNDPTSSASHSVLIICNGHGEDVIALEIIKRILKKIKKCFWSRKKRKIIGNLFIKIFERYAKKIKNVKFLAQGTLYPDLIESRSVTGSQTSKIKSHHNVGGLPKKWN